MYINYISIGCTLFEIEVGVIVGDQLMPILLYIAGYFRQ